MTPGSFFVNNITYGKQQFAACYRNNPAIPPQIIIGIGPTLNLSEATSAAPNNTQLFQSGKFSLTTFTLTSDSSGSPSQLVSNIRITAAAPIRPATEGRSQDITPSKIRLLLNFM